MKKSIVFLCTLLAAIAAHAPAYAESPCGVPALTECPTPLDKNLPGVKNMLTWDQKERVIGFRNDYRSYKGDVFKHSKAQPLPHELTDLSNVFYSLGKDKYDLARYIERNDVTGLLVIKNGKIVLEYYGQGNTDKTLWTSRSVGKSVVSTLVGVAIKEGKIKSLDDAVVKYNPDVAGTVWANVTLRQLLQHTSGVVWSENYENPKSDFAKLTQCEAGDSTYACVHDLIISKTRKAYAKPGEAWSYSSGGAWLLGDTLEKAVGMPIAQYLQDEVWGPYGMSNDGVWHSYKLGKHDVGAHGFNATLEDWGKFGEFVLNNGKLPSGENALPTNWVEDARAWNQAKNSITAAHPEGTYGYEWWNNSVPKNAGDVAPKQGLDDKDTLWGLGIFGQMMVINPKENLVIIQWSTWPKAEPSFSEQPLEAALMFNAIANYLK